MRTPARAKPRPTTRTRHRALRGASGAAGSGGLHAVAAVCQRGVRDAAAPERQRALRVRCRRRPSTTTPDRGDLHRCIGATKQAATDTTWRMICEVGALTEVPIGRHGRSLAGFGVLGPQDRMTGSLHRRISMALSGRPEVGIVEELRRGQKTKLYRRLT